MFDFIIKTGVTKNSSIIVESLNRKELLKDVEYNHDFYIGEWFSLDYLYRNDSSPNIYHTEGDVLFWIGEIYSNYYYQINKSVKPHKIDGEELYRLIRDYKEHTIDYIKGTFVFCIIDKLSANLKLYNSRNGLYDLYYFSFNGHHLISPSIDLIILEENENEIDKVSVIQHAIFDYPLGLKTLYKKIKVLRNGSILNLINDKLNESPYYNYKSGIDSTPELDWSQTLELLPDVFNDSLDLLVEDKVVVNASITSGFDSRTNLSRLFKINQECYYFSWGIRGNIEEEIPRMISNKIGINYSVISLEDDFEKEYDYFGAQSVMFSGVKGTIRRANHNFAYSKLSKNSDSVITGLFGSEILRPTNSLGHVFNENFKRLFYSSDKKEELDKIFQSEINKRILKNEFLIENKECFFEQTLHYFEQLNIFKESYLNLYYFMLTEGFRKYFGHEIHGSRMHVKVMSPYIDDDFIDLILRSPIPHLNKFAFKRNLKSIKLGQLIYMPIIKKNLPVLMKIPTGRFYSPAQLESKFYHFYLLLSIIRKRFKTNNAIQTFNSNKWVNSFAHNHPELLKYENDFLLPIDTNYLTLSLEDLAKTISLRLWLRTTE